MPGLTISNIITHLKKDTLPDHYNISSPATLNNDELIEILSLFKESSKMIAFISKLSNQENISVIVNSHSIPLGSLEKFVNVYSKSSSRFKLSDEKRENIFTHLSGRRFDKKQLNYLLKNLSMQDVRDFVLETGCYYSADLTAICNDFSLLKAFTYNTIKLLYHYLNPIRHWRTSITPFLDMAYFSYRAGHVLGLDADIKLKLTGQVYTFKTGAEYSEVSLKILVNYLDAYRQRYPSPIFDAIYLAMKSSHSLFIKNSCYYRTDAAKIFLQQYNENKIAYVSAGWDGDPYGHGVGVALYGNYLVYCNRGPGGDRRSGCKIFEITDTSLINEAFFQRLGSSLDNMNEFHKIIGKVINFKDPIVKFKSKQQNHPNCTFANPKSTIEALILLVQAGPVVSRQALTKLAATEQKSVRRKYKNFTTFIRDREIDELIKNMFYATHPDLLVFYAELTKTIIREHHGKNRGYIKDKQEVIRAVDLYARTPNSIKDLIKKDIEFTELMKKIKAEQKTLIQEKEAPLHAWSRTQIIRGYKNQGNHKVVIKKNYIVSVDGTTTPKMPFSMRNARKMISVVS